MPGAAGRITNAHELGLANHRITSPPRHQVPSDVPTVLHDDAIYYTVSESASPALR